MVLPPCLCTWQCLVCDKNWDTCSAPLVIAYAVQMGEPEVGDERGTILECRTTLDVGAQQRPLLARDTVTLVFVQWQCASAVEAARKHRVQDGQDVVGDQAASEGARLAARRARKRRLEAAGTRIAHDVTVETLVDGRQADAPANRTTHAVHDPLPLCHHRRHGIRGHGHPKLGRIDRIRSYNPTWFFYESWRGTAGRQPAGAGGVAVARGDWAGPGPRSSVSNAHLTDLILGLL